MKMAYRNSDNPTSGAALLTVLVAMMIMSIMLFEFQYLSSVERKLAYNDINQLQAYYLAKSGVRIGLLRVSLYARAKRDPTLKNLGPGMDVKQYLDMIWSLPLPAFPPPKESLGKMLKSDKDAAEKTLKQTRISDGQFTHVITSESSKINLNYLQVPPNLQNERLSFTGQPQGLFQYVGLMLINLIDNFIRDSENPQEEYGNLRAEDVVFDIMDWINPGDNRFMGGSKDSFYETQRPPYKAKRNRFYTIDELKLVRGMDDHLFQKLKPYVTVYSYDGRININTAGANVFRALYKDFTEDDIKRILEERSRIGSWSSEKQFVDFVTNTLNRHGFKTLYDKDKEYPFATTTQSFLVESMGVLTRSKSQITKVIRAAVTLTSGKGGQVTSDKNNEQECNRTPGRFWDKRVQQCKTKPRSKEECEYPIAGSWEQQGTKNCCKINTVGAVCLEPADQGALSDANAMKILFWSET